MELNTESIILKSLISNGEFFGKTAPILEAKYFADVSNQNIFKLLKDHYNSYKVIPTLTEIVASIQKVPNEEARAGIINNIKIINGIEEVQNIEFLLDTTVEFVQDAMYTEALILGSDGLTEKNNDKKVKAKAIMEEMSKISVDTDLGLDFDDIDEMIAYLQNKKIGILTQHAEFNKRLGTGFLPGTLSVIAASSGIGKSMILGDFATGMIQDGKNILLVSMEMQDAEIMKRVYANALNLPINDLTELPEEVIKNAHEGFSSGKIGKFIVKDFPNGSFSAQMLDQLLDTYKVEKGITFDLVMLDYLGIMKSDLVPPSIGTYSYVKSIVEEVRSIAKKQKIPILSPNQLNRSAVNNTEASNDSISDSLGVIMTADFIVFLLQNEQMKEENLITCKVTKNRFNGRTDSFDMSIDYTRMRFADMLVPSTGGLTDTQTIEIISDVYKQDAINMRKKDLVDDGFDLMNELGL